MIQKLVFTLLIASVLTAMPLTAASDDPLWIDVRTAQEFSDGHVPQALNIPYDEIAGRIETIAPDKDALIYVYCRSGRRSGIAKETLDGMGYTQVINAGGLDDAMEMVEQDSRD